MAAPKHPGEDVVRKAWREYGPNITATAYALGLQRKHLRAHLHRLGLLPWPSHSAAALSDSGGQKSKADPLTRSGLLPRLQAVSQELAKSVEQGEMAQRVRELGEARKTTRPQVRVKNAEAEIIRSGRRRLAAITDMEVDDDDLLALFIRDRFPRFIEEMEADLRQAQGIEPEPDQ